IGEDRRRAIMVADDHVHVAIVVEVCNSQSSSGMFRSKIIAGFRAQNMKPATGVLPTQRWAGRPRPYAERSVRHNDVGPAVEVKIDECRSPTDVGKAVGIKS